MTSKLLRWITIFVAISVILAATYIVAYTGEREVVGGRVNLPTVQSTAAALAIHTATATFQTATVPATFTPIPTFTNTPPPNTTPTHTYTPSPTPTETPLPTATPTLAVAQNTDNGPSPTPEYTAVPTIETPSEVTNILLLGSDTVDGTAAGARTDTIIIASINRETKTASMLSVPRDLYVSIPGWWNNRINTVLTRGDSSGYPGGGVQLLKDTVQHNFGIPIHYYARVDFEGFKEIVDAIGGIEIGVSCTLTDWRLKSPELDINVEENWELFTLEPGIYEMDGDLALWYARSRRTTSDFDRGRRQQQMLRAILNQGVDLGLVSQFPSLWETFSDTVETDMDIGRALQLATIASAVRERGIQHLYLTQGELESFVVPDSGAQVQLLNWEEAETTFRRLYQSPAINQASKPLIRVQIINGSGDPDLALLAADNLAWYGFAPILSDVATESSTTSLTYYGQNFKGSYNWLVSWIFNKGRAEVALDSDLSPEGYDYQVVIGTDYKPCRNPLYAPRPSFGE